MFQGLRQRPRVSMGLMVAIPVGAMSAAYLVDLRTGHARTRTPPPQVVGTENLPDFQQLPSVEARKTNFFGYLRPIVRAENSQIRRKRQRLKELVAQLQGGGSIAPDERRWLTELAGKYRVATENRDLAQVGQSLLRKVDIIPASLVLVQAAKESAWGTSRFAQQGNNLFGQWCFTEGCGIVPARRSPGKSHEVQVYPNVRAAVESYMRNLNSHPSYETLRTIRAGLRRQGETITGFALAGGLRHYSAQGMDYVASVRAMIRQNDLGEGERGT